MKIINVLIILAIIVGMNACNEDEIFEREQYKTVFALVSEDGYNVFRVVHDLEEPESVGYIAVSMGGTRPTEHPVEIIIAPDMDAFERYNVSNFDVDFSNYARLVPNYIIDDYKLTVAAGERSGRMPVRVKPDGLSPDSTYFIPLKIEDYDQYEANPNKSNVLYQVLMKNRYATTEAITNYTMIAYRDGTMFPGVKTMHPISRNKVRIMVDNLPFQADIDEINKFAIVLEITNDNNVIITPYEDINVEQIDGDAQFPNIFRIEDEGFRKFKVFLLRYNYWDGAIRLEMKEELRLEFIE